jgi:hypothetical protein
VNITDSMAAGQSFTRQSCKQTARNNRHLLSRSPVISRCRSWVMLLLVYVGPWATHFTGYCCWFYTKVGGASGNTIYWVLLFGLRGLRATHITGYCCLVYVGLRQHTLLGIVVGLCGASGNTLYWVLLFGLRGPRATHITGDCWWFMWGLGQHTHKQNHMPLLPYLRNNLLYKLLAYSQTCTLPQSRPEDGNILVIN